MNFNYIFAANICLGISISALLMAEYGLSSLIGGWRPTYETAIAFGIISIAFSNIGKK